MSSPRASILLALILVVSAVTAVAVAVAAGAPAPATAPDASLLHPRALAPELRAFARHRGVRHGLRAGVSPIRGPVDFGTAINRFGIARGGHAHGGQDVFAPTGTPLYAVYDGVMLEAGTDGARGNYAILYAPRVRRTFVYMHMAAPAAVRTGAHVRAGRRVGAVGCTGSCQGPHLHFEVHRGRGAQAPGVDPLPALRRWLRS